MVSSEYEPILSSSSRRPLRPTLYPGSRAWQPTTTTTMITAAAVATAAVGSLMDGFNQYREEGLGVLKACWGIWVPAQFLNFWLVPPNFRIAFIACMGSVWEIVLSYMAPMVHTGPLTEPHQEDFEEVRKNQLKCDESSKM